MKDPFVIEALHRKPRVRALLALEYWRRKRNPYHPNKRYTPSVLKALKEFRSTGLRYALEIEAGKTIPQLAREIGVDAETVATQLTRFTDKYLP